MMKLADIDCEMISSCFILIFSLLFPFVCFYVSSVNLTHGENQDASECLAYILNSIIIRLFLFYDQKTRRNAGHTIFGLDHIIKRYIVLPMNMMLKRGIRILLTSLSLHSRPNTEC